MLKWTQHSSALPYGGIDKLLTLLPACPDNAQNRKKLCCIRSHMLTAIISRIILCQWIFITVKRHP